MKLLKIFVAAILALAAALTGGCSDDDGIDNRDLDYGYVQFKLYKEASYDAVSRAQKPQLDYLYEAAKVQVSLGCNGTTVTQTLTLSASDKESAEFGLRSEKLRLLTGQYQIITFSLYDANDELIYNGMPLDDRLVVEAGGLQVHDLTVDVEPRGKVRFTIRKDLSDFTETPVTRAADRQYTFDEIAFISLTVKQGETNEQTTFKMLPTKFSIHFDEDDDTFGYQTSSLECDTRPTTRTSCCWRPTSGPRTSTSPSRTTRPPKRRSASRSTRPTSISATTTRCTKSGRRSTVPTGISPARTTPQAPTGTSTRTPTSGC